MPFTFYLYISKEYVLYVDTFLKKGAHIVLRYLTFVHYVPGTERTSTNSIHAAKIQFRREESEFHRCRL